MDNVVDIDFLIEYNHCLNWFIYRNILTNTDHSHNDIIMVSYGG